ncbi:hybrid sensor histidine kinase/response regulator [Colwellia sp. MB02u-9]|uniref:ATP-binding response regulator n=1 Tax=Colwellia sp. MB02u-9 TaxID=2759823 RepID=UPI0015F4538C|nr:hybrid sensor histidine kinase/response regulator [Colwellia sp. MB02u-9]MBA6296428.1 hybrid sensor histidine kinase/response regulator [Colwellia sp. MB02u-9]
MLDHILIVDESRLVREALAKILLSCGISKNAIACIENAEDAIEYAQFSTISLLICADNLTSKNSLNFRDELAKASKIKQLPLMVLLHQIDEKNSALNLDKAHNIKCTLTNSISLFPPFRKQYVIEALFALTQNAIFTAQTHQEDDNDSGVLSKPASNTAPVLLAQKPTILVVDDESSNIDVAAGNLRDLYRVMAAKSGEHALKIVANNKYNIRLILLDIMMPKMDGYQVCKSLKDNEASASIPVIFLSAKALVEDIKYGFDLGAVDYITKPLNGDLLRARVATHIRLQQQKLDLSAQVATLKENAKLREDIEKITHHDLKAPLNNILFETYRLADKKAAKSINRAVNNVVNMVNNSLNVYKIEQGIYTLMPQATNLNLLIDDAINAISSISHDKKVHFVLNGFDSEYAIMVEPLLCLSIFNNLIKNAVEASPVNHAITIALTHDNNDICFKLTNHGIIAKHLRSSLFEKYTSSNHSTGTGLGTYSAKLMTEVQHGEISFTIINEQQTQFIVKLPAA